MPARLCSAALLGLVMILSLSSCSAADDPSGGAPQVGGTEPPVVLASFSVLADITAAVGGEHVDVRSITPPEAEVHEYSPTPGDLRDVAEADLILINGLGLETWYEQFFTHSSTQVLTVSEGVQTLPVTRLPGQDSPGGTNATAESSPEQSGPGQSSPEQEHLPVNPHAWMSPEQGLVYVDNIAAALSELSPEDAEHFRENAESYREQIRRLWDDADRRLEPLRREGDVHLVTCEGAFSYLASDLGLAEHYLWPLNAENEGSPQQVEAQIRYVQRNEVPTIFCESTVNDSAQQQVAVSAGAQLSGPLYVDSVTEATGPAPSYLELLEHDLDLIIEGAQG